MWGPLWEDEMPKRGPHPYNALTALAVRKLRSRGAAGRVPDGNGLYLEDGRRWLQRIVVHGRRRDIGLGSVDLVSLAEVREKALRLRKIAREGGDPLAEKRALAAIPTFEQAARTVHAGRKFKNAKHGAQWIKTLETYAFKHIGAMRIDVVDSPDVLRVLEPIWNEKPETASRVRQRIGVVMNWAKAKKYRTGENPVAGVKDALPERERTRGHFTALPYAEISTFIEELRAAEGTAARALEFAVLTASRTGEVLYAKPEEIDLQAGIWTVPAERMKAKRTHRVPLAPRAIEILKAQPGGKFLFGGDAPLSNMAMLALLARMGRDVTVHGFRSTFKDWASELTSFPNIVSEMALAHTIGDKTEAAYRRGELFEKRKKLMLEWARYCAMPKPAGKVTPIRRTA